jgi:tRNA(Arg) A34 adenosine deaminase TadA
MNQAFLREAIALSIKKIDVGEGGPFGSIVVKDEEIIARRRNRATSTNGPTAYAEITAIREAYWALNTFDLFGFEIYSSCEPCPMCLAAIYWARLDKLAFAAGREDAADASFDDDFLYAEFFKPWKPQRLSAEARQAFEAWKNKENRMDY